MSFWNKLHKTILVIVGPRYCHVLVWHISRWIRRISENCTWNTFMREHYMGISNKDTEFTIKGSWRLTTNVKINLNLLFKKKEYFYERTSVRHLLSSGVYVLFVCWFVLIFFQFGSGRYFANQETSCTRPKYFRE